MTATKKALKKKQKGAAMVEYAILVGSVALIGILGMSVLGRKAADIIGTLAVILPGGNANEDLKLHVASLIELTDDGAGDYRIDASHIGGGDSDRIGRNTGLQSEGSDSLFVLAN